MRVKALSARVLLLFLLPSLLFVPVVVAGCDGDSITLGYVERYPSLPWVLAEAEGCFEEEGLDVELESFSAEEELWRAWQRKKVDAAYSGLGGSVNAAGNGLEDVIVMLGAKSNDSGIVARPGVDGVTGLVGQRVGVRVGSEEHFLLYFVLERNGIPESSVKTTDVPESEGQEMLARGELDAWVVSEPYLSEAANVTGASLIFTCSEIGEFLQYQLSVRSGLVDEQPEVAGALVRAWFDGRDLMEEEVSGARQTAVGFLGMSEEQVDGLARGVHFYTEDEELELALSPEPFKWMGRIEYALKYQGVLDSGFDVVQVMNLNVAAHALATE